MSNFRLYEISGLLREAMSAAESTIDEDGVIEDSWADFLEDCQIERDEKILAVAAMCQELKAEASAIKAEAQRIDKRAKTAENKAKSLKNYLQRYVQVGEKFKDKRVSVSWTTSHPVVIADESKLPRAAFKEKLEVSKTNIKELIENKAIKSDVAYIAEKKSIIIK